MPRVKLKLTGYDAALKKAKTLEELIPIVLANALHGEAKRMMRRSQEVVPKVTGRLASAGYVKKPVFYGPYHASVELGYDPEIAPYAFAVHELPRSGQTKGFDPQGSPYPPRSWATTGQWKYLDNPVSELAPTAPARIAAEVRANLQALRLK